jgi:GrpB-like predicted nucleotidyltransferase (UPF0157 family)
VGEQERPGDRVGEPVLIVPYDQAWPARFEAERCLLQEAIGAFAVGGIHHVGSTSVAGLDAKPVIDILAGVVSLDAARPCIGLLAPLDYLYAPYHADQMLWFCKPHPSRRTHHLHLVPARSSRFRDELRFRDCLRADPDAAARYALLKKELAAQYRHDRDAYTQAKTRFVRTVLGRAG